MGTRLRRSEVGLSLIEILITVAIASGVVLGISSILVRSQSEHSVGMARLDLVDLYTLTLGVMGDPTACGCQMTGKIVDLSVPKPSLSLDSVRASCAVGAPALARTPASSATGGTLLNSIRLEEIISTGNSNEYLAKLTLNPDSSKLIRSIKPTQVSLRFYTDPTTPANAKKIAGCGAAPLSVPTGLMATPGNGQCTLSWTASSGATPITYNVKYSTTSGTAASQPVSGTTAGTTWVVSPLANGTRYYFAVNATNPGGSTAFSSEVYCDPVMPLPSKIAKHYRNSYWGCWVRSGSSSNYVLQPNAGPCGMGGGSSCPGQTRSISTLRGNGEGSVYSSGCNEGPSGAIQEIP